MSRFRNFFVLTLIVLLTESAWAAQSTADVPITGELRAAAREKVLGKAVAVSSEE